MRWRTEGCVEGARLGLLPSMPSQVTRLSPRPGCCDVSFSPPWTSGSNHTSSFLPPHAVMIRRMKKEAMPEELPPKEREYIKVAVDPVLAKQIDELLREKEVSQSAP